MSLASWYHQQYANTPYSRVARRRMVPFLASPQNISPTAIAQHQAHVTVDMSTPMDDGFGGADKKDKTLFGPPVGTVAAEERAKWGAGGSEEREELPPDVLKKWVERSAETSTPTTTLQALTNLKRPSIRLSPLHVSADAPPDPLAPHVLEFSYDADSPLVAITVRVLPTQPLEPSSPTASSAPPAADPSKTAGEEVFCTIFKGGFAQSLTAESGAIIELGRFETVPPPSTSTSTSTSAPPSSTSPPQAPALPPLARAPSMQRRRFSFLTRSHRHSTAAPLARAQGPALPLVDALAYPAPALPPISPAVAAQLGFQVIDRREREREEAREAERREAEASGVRIGIWVEALDANGKQLPNRNAQATFLHVHRVGARHTAEQAAGSNADTVGEPSAAAAPAAADDKGPDTRPWIVRVVHREAIIGKHTFTLHEIYGLASSTTTTTTAPTPPPPSHAYPPTSPAAPAPPEPLSSAPECILCLSTPRSVVLMPCRHLVACRECAVNMLEFGAGGSVVQPGDEAAAAIGTEGAAGPGAGEGSAPGPAPVPREGRRKKKVKGWFCPICRQPYTSMLRISTAAPEGELVAEIEHEEDLGPRASTSSAPKGWKEHADAPTPAATTPEETVPAPEGQYCVCPVHGTPITGQPASTSTPLSPTPEETSLPASPRSATAEAEPEREPVAASSRTPEARLAPPLEIPAALALAHPLAAPSASQ